MTKVRAFYFGIISFCLCTAPISARADQKLADEVAAKVVEVSEALWGFKLEKPLSVRLKDPTEGKADSRYPSSWDPRGETYHVSLLRDFDLSQTWWNMRPTDSAYSQNLKTASLEQKYILVLSHEITHLFTFPSPWQPWFQETIGMRIGESIALKLDPSLKQFFDSAPTRPVTLAELKEVDSYGLIRPPHVERCRKFQRESYWYSLGFSAEHFLDWGKKVRNSKYVPWEDKRETKRVDEELTQLRSSLRAK